MDSFNWVLEITLVFFFYSYKTKPINDILKYTYYYVYLGTSLI